ncbi:MAG: GNAT family N-acetyltransferase [Acidimicrobiales bacterium]
MNATRHVVRSRAEAVSEVVARAFADDPVMCWIFDDAPDPARSLTAFMRIVCERSISVGHAYELTEGEGAALWAPPDSSLFNEVSGREVFRLLSEAYGPKRAEAVLVALREATDFHPEEPHFYLSTIGVDPESRGNGYGAKLLSRVLDVCDSEDTLAYLESSNPRNISLYERHGFKAITEVRLPDGPVMTPMIRTPESRQSS